MDCLINVLFFTVGYKPLRKSCKKYTKKVKSYLKLMMLCLLTSMIILAYGDDPVTVVEDEFNQPRFNWRNIDIPADGFAGIWINDTNIYYSILM